jgi:hypothetical protein
MYKKASANSQSRVDRRAVHSSENTAGVDLSTFSKHPAANADVDRAKLIRDKT